MKIECVKEKLKNALGVCSKVVGKSLTHPILSCFLLEAKDGVLSIRATNLDLGVEVTLPVKIFEPGVIALPGSVLFGFVMGLPDEKNITIESVGGIATISIKNISTNINTQDSSDFPSIPRIGREEGVLNQVNSHDIVSGFKSSWFSAATSSVKPELSSVCVFSDNETMFFVATDSFRLAEKVIQTKKHKEFKNVLIPVKNIPELIRILEDVDGVLDVITNKNQIAFISEGLYITSRVIDGIFPDYKQIIPKEPTTEIVILKEDLLQNLKLANIFSDTFNQINISISPKEKKIGLKTKNQNIGEHKGFIDGVIKGEELSINFNYKYLIDGFQSIHSDSVSLGFSGLNKPMVIRGVSDKSFLYLVMPMNR